MMNRPEIKERLQFLVTINGHREAFLKRYSQDDIRQLLEQDYLEQKKVKVRDGARKNGFPAEVVRYQITKKGYQLF